MSDKPRAETRRYYFDGSNPDAPILIERRGGSDRKIPIEIAKAKPEGRLWLMLMGAAYVLQHSNESVLAGILDGSDLPDRSVPGSSGKTKKSDQWREAYAHAHAEGATRKGFVGVKAEDKDAALKGGRTAAQQLDDVGVKRAMENAAVMRWFGMLYGIDEPVFVPAPALDAAA